MKSSWYQRKWLIVLVHVAAWALLFSLPYLLSSPDNGKHPDTTKELHNDAARNYFSLIMNITWVAFFYFNAFILIPQFIFKKRYWQFALMQLASISWLLIQVSILYKLFFPASPMFSTKGLLFNILIYLFIFGLSTAYKLISEKVNSDKLAAEKMNENLKTELSLLRSQASPHFMFNVLNNMVALARKQSDQLEPSLIKLSSLMRYMLYEADEERVSLEKEIEYLQSYIDLQQQRFGKKVQVTVDLHPADKAYTLEPMLLIPFVENAFKHGTGMIEDAQIDIELKAEKNILQFTVRNKFNPASVEIKDKTSGIGLTNVKRRLNLLYGKNHSLLITTNDNRFVVSLQIFLS